VGEIEDYIIFVGNLIVDFNYEMMARVLKVPDEKFRDKIYKTIYENLSTIKRELADSKPPRDVPPTGELWALMADKFAATLGPLDAQPKVDDEWRAKADELAEQYITDEWLFRGRPQHEERKVKIRAGVEIKHNMHKAPGGLIRAVTQVEDDVIVHVDISGDFFFYPVGRLVDLEAALVGVTVGEVEQAVARFYEEQHIETPGVTAADLAQVIG